MATEDEQLESRLEEKLLERRTNRDKMYVWEKRLTMAIAIGLLTYIASIATDVKTEIAVFKKEFKGVFKTLTRHEMKLTTHDKDIKDHDKRLTIVETRQNIKGM